MSSIEQPSTPPAPETKKFLDKAITRRDLFKLTGLTAAAVALDALTSKTSQSTIENNQEGEDEGEAFNLALGNRAIELELELANEELTPEKKQLIEKELAIVDVIARDLFKIMALHTQIQEEENEEKQENLKAYAQKIIEEVQNLTKPQDSETTTVQLKNTILKI